MTSCIVYIWSTSHTQWICYRCGMPNLTDSTLFGTLSTSNSFDVLANLNSESESSNEVPITPNFSNGHIGSPKHTSSPTKSNKTSGKKCNSSRNNRGKPTQRRLKLMNINFQSIRNKIPAFQTLVEKEKPDVIFGTETWLDESMFCNEILPSNYQFFREGS